jgi:DNA-binding response OmpR family regulator
MIMSEKRILVVEDEQEICEMYAMAFSRAGYSVKTAKSAEEALDIMVKTPYAVLYLDLNLPAMSGIELCRQIRKGWPMSICFAVTGYASLFEITDCRDAGFEDYFTKPVNLSDLMTAAEYAFNKIARWKKR